MASGEITNFDSATLFRNSVMAAPSSRPCCSARSSTRFPKALMIPRKIDRRLRNAQVLLLNHIKFVLAAVRPHAKYRSPHILDPSAPLLGCLQSQQQSVGALIVEL